MHSIIVATAVLALALLALGEDCLNNTIIAGNPCIPMWKKDPHDQHIPCCKGSLTCTWFRETDTATCRLVAKEQRNYAILVAGQSNAFGQYHD
eukprot:m.321226 g.321226  ORF g.321226 m.321226 type:complete len:93 (-) comp76172_c0_seq1:3-281(-)